MRCSYPLPDGICPELAVASIRLVEGETYACGHHLGWRLLELLSEGYQQLVVRRVTRWSQARIEATLRAREIIAQGG